MTSKEKNALRIWKSKSIRIRKRSYGHLKWLATLSGNSIIDLASDIIDEWYAEHKEYYSV